MRCLYLLELARPGSVWKAVFSVCQITINLSQNAKINMFNTGLEEMLLCVKEDLTRTGWQPETLVESEQGDTDRVRARER